jgi:hypothetical protein
MGSKGAHQADLAKPGFNTWSQGSVTIYLVQHPEKSHDHEVQEGGQQWEELYSKMLGLGRFGVQYWNNLTFVVPIHGTDIAYIMRA